MFNNFFYGFSNGVLSRGIEPLFQASEACVLSVKLRERI